MTEVINNQDGTIVIRVTTTQQDGSKQISESKPLTQEEANNQLYNLIRRNKEQSKDIEKNYKEIRKVLQDDAAAMDVKMKALGGKNYLEIESETILRALQGNWVLTLDRTASEITIINNQVTDQDDNVGTITVTETGSFTIAGLGEDIVMKINSETGRIQGTQGTDAKQKKAKLTRDSI